MRLFGTGGFFRAAESHIPGQVAERSERNFLWSISIRGIGAVCLVMLVGIRIWDPFPVELLRLKSLDAYQRLMPRTTSALPAVIVDIDDESLSKHGQWPWPRTLVSELVQKLFGAGAVVVGLDILFPEPDRMSPAVFAAGLHDLPSEIRKELHRLPNNDEVFAGALKRLRVVLGRAASSSPTASSSMTEIVRRPIAELGGDPRRYLPAFPSLVPNIPILERAAQGAGVLSLTPEIDGVVRRVPAFIRVGNDMFPSLVVEMLRVATGQSAIAVRSNEAGIDSVVVARARIPTDGRGRVWVNFAPHDPRRYISAHEVLDGRVSRDRLFRKLVFVGTSASGLSDLKTTPVATNMPGVEVHAQLVETILSNTYLSRPNYALGAEIGLILVSGIVVIVLVPLLGAWWTLLIGAGTASALVALSIYLYVDELILLDVSYSAFASFSVFAVLGFLNYTRVEAGRRQITHAFSRYLSPEIVSRIAEDPQQLVLGGQDREMTLLFSDVHGFTTLSENYDATGLTNLINRVLTPLTHAVLDTGGTVDKYMGDALMAFWNAPLDDADHAQNACRAALSIRAAIAPLNESLRKEAEALGHPFHRMDVGVGIHSGMCCVGNMGSDLRFDYSVLGDTVNTAARLEGLTRQYRVGVVVGETTYQLQRGLALLELDLVRVVGKTVPVRIFTLVGDESLAESDAYRKLAESHAEVLSAYRKQDWDAADRSLAVCRLLDETGLTGGYYDLWEERISAFRTDPPPVDWDGVFESESKH